MCVSQTVCVSVCVCGLDGSPSLRRCAVDSFIGARSLQLRGERGGGEVGGLERKIIFMQAKDWGERTKKKIFSFNLSVFRG